MANESQSLFKIVVFLGLVLFMASIMATPWVYVGQPIPPNSTWGRMQTQMSSFPQFTNPFDSRGSVEMFGAADGNSTPAQVVNADPTNITHCTQSTNPTANWYGCLLIADQATAYVMTNATHPAIKLNLSDAVGTSGGSVVLTLFATIQCKATGISPVTTKVDFIFERTNGSVFEFAQYATCNPGDFANNTLRVDFTAQPRASVADYADGKVYIQGQGSTNNIAVSYFHLRLEYTDPDCAGADTLTYIGCVFGQAFRVLFNVVLFIVNGLIFVGQVLIWFVGMIGTFFSSILSLVGVDGAPPVIAGFVGILLLGLFFYVAFVVMGKVRGTGNTG